MKIIVTHTSPDWDAIASVWILKKYLAGWQHAKVEFVPAGQKSMRSVKLGDQITSVIEETDGDEIIHVDTGMGPLDHHQIFDTNICGASRVWDYIQSELKKSNDTLTEEHLEAMNRIVKVVVDIDHFKEVFWADPAADHHEFSLIGVLDGLKLFKPDQDSHYVDFGIECLDSMYHAFETRIWAEKEIKENGIYFDTRWGKAVGFLTLNDTVIKLSQKMGFVLVLRKDPRKGYVRIKVRPHEEGKENIDLTPIYEKLKDKDPDATWYLHVSKKMLLNGTPKNPKMIPTKLSLEEIIKTIKEL